MSSALFTDLLVSGLIVFTIIWIYLDASKYKIGRIPGEKGMFNLSAGAWAVSAILLWILVFPVYLIKRRGLIEKAQEKPVEATSRSIKAGALSAIGGFWILLIILGHMAMALPGCDSADTRAVVRDIINGPDLFPGDDVQFISLNSIREQGFNEEDQIRACYAVLVTTRGEGDLQYLIKWIDRNKGEYYVEAGLQ